jgi:hypothetical protein
MSDLQLTFERLGDMKRQGRRWGAPAAMAIVLTVSACNFDVVNPGPILDSDLDSLTGHASLVNGMQRSFQDAIDWIGYWGAAMAFEIHPAGSTGSFGIPPNVQNGTMDPDDASARWSDAHQARWVAEDGLRRFAEVYDAATFDASIHVARAFLWAGYSSRLLGENFCDAVFDGGAQEPHTAYFTRAEQHFTDAIRVGTAVATTAGTTVVNAATAGRASVRASLATYDNNNPATWAAAAADAAAITSNTYAFQLPNSTQDLNQYNHLMWAGSATGVTQGSPYRAHTQWGTYYEDYFTTTGDPRVPFVIARNSAGTLLRGDANVGRFGTNCTKTIGTQALCSSNLRVPFLPQAKFTAQNTPTNLSTGWEMRLIRAEERLVNNDVPAAVTLMNVRRAALNPVQPPFDPAMTLTEAWTALKSERGLELWLEARRLGDLRRWADASSPGTTYDGAYFLQGGVLTRTEDMSARHLCMPIGRAELETNPNIQP